jgi:hypothetical protein
MKRFKIVLILLAFAINLLIAPPSWADPDLTVTPDYAEVTQAINFPLNTNPEDPGAVKLKLEEIQQQLGNLKLQKYISSRYNTHGVSGHQSRSRNTVRC